MTQMETGGGGMHMEPHRGTMILVFGILGLVFCVIFGIVAWVMGNGDLRKMEAGTMDPSGEGMTKAGKICGMIAVILNCGVLCIYGILFIFVIGAGAAAAGSGP